MKKHLLLWAVFLLPLFSYAQLPLVSAANLLITGINAGSQAARNRANKPGEFVTYLRVGADSVACKRTPEAKLRGNASADIRSLEHYLASTNAEYTRAEREFTFDQGTVAQYVQRIQSQQPKWDVAPYQQEAAFYAQQSQQRYAAARQREQLAREVAQQRSAARQDSIRQVAQRHQAHIDSIARVVFARQQAAEDSVERATERAYAKATQTVSAPAKAPTTARPRPVAKPAVHQAPRATAGPKVYVCGNGRTAVYHSSEGCSAMRRCSHQALAMSEGQARGSGLRGCMKCN